MMAFLGVFWYLFKTFIWKKYWKSKNKTKYLGYVEFGVRWGELDRKQEKVEDYCWVVLESTLSWQINTTLVTRMFQLSSRWDRSQSYILIVNITNITHAIVSRGVEKPLTYKAPIRSLLTTAVFGAQASF